MTFGQVMALQRGFARFNGGGEAEKSGKAPSAEDFDAAIARFGAD